MKNQQALEILKNMMRAYWNELENFNTREETRINFAEKMQIGILKDKISAPHTAITAVEKQIPQKPIHYIQYVVPRCPCCKTKLGEYQGEEVICYTEKNICECGQKLDWSESA